MPTYAFVLNTSQWRVIFSKAENARALMEVLFRLRGEGQFLLHGFAILPVQAHLLLTPLRERTAERSAHLIRDDFTRKVRLRIPGELWQTWNLEHRVRNEQDFQLELGRIAALPELRGMREYPFVHTQCLEQMDEMPETLRFAGERVRG